MYEQELQDNYILNRMLERVSDKLDKRESSVIFDTISSTAIELCILYIELESLIQNSYGDTASREYLIRRCKERGIEPYPATKAILKGEFTPTTVDVLGQRFNIGSMNFVAVEKTADGEYQMQCETAGVVGNQQLGTMIPIEYIEGLETAELTEVLIPGEDEEETEELRKRYFDSLNAVAFGGNIADYKAKTNAIDGVGATKVTPVWDGGGTVLLTIQASDYGVASDELVAEVQDIIDPTDSSGEGVGLAPIGHSVTVESTTSTTINVTTDIIFDTGYSWDNLYQDIEDAVKAYLLEQRKLWADSNSLIIRISQIETRILAVSGIVDISNTKINNSTSNLTLDEYAIPIFGGVSE